MPPVDGVVGVWVTAGGSVGGCVPDPGGLVPAVGVRPSVGRCGASVGTRIACVGGTNVCGVGMLVGPPTEGRAVGVNPAVGTAGASVGTLIGALGGCVPESGGVVPPVEGVVGVWVTTGGTVGG